MRKILILSLLFLVGFVNASDADKFEKKQYKGKEGVLPYRFLSPEKLEKGRKYPLVIFLHGAGERGNDNTAQLKHFVKRFAALSSAHPCFVIAPQCPKGKRWVEVNWGDPKPHKIPAKPSYGMGLLLELIPEIESKYPVDPKRIYAVGLSMGGFGTWDIICRQPDKFAAAIPICGGADNSKAMDIASVSLWVWHGANDNVVKTVRSRSMVEDLKKAGGKPIYSELPGVGHGSWGPASKSDKLFEWLFEQRKK